MKREELEIAKLAASVSGALKNVDSKMTDNPRPANRTDPRRFISGQARHIQNTSTRNIPGNSIDEMPKSRPAGSEILGTVDVNPQDLMIGNMDADMQKRVQSVIAHERGAPLPVHPGVPVTEPSVPAPVVGKVELESNTTPDSYELLKSIDEKLGKILEILEHTKS